MSAKIGKEAAKVSEGVGKGAKASSSNLLITDSGLATSPQSSKGLYELVKPMDQALINKMEQKGWTVVVAKDGSEDFKYLSSIGAEASISSGHPKHILIKDVASKSTLLEEYLHGTQLELGLLKKYGSQQALEVHAKDFMLRHAKMLGLENQYDIRLLQQLQVEETAKLNNLVNRGNI